MADPHIKSEMDWLDILSVIVYRLGFVLAVPSILLLPWEVETGIPAQKMCFVAAAMCAACLHIYMKTFRLLLQATTWGGLICYVLGFGMFGLGGTFITLGGLCFKEYFCFKVPGLRAQPLILAGLWFSLVLDAPLVTQALAAVSALLFLIVSIAKWRMPLHFDIGDKTKYEV
ncbi:DUF2301 domain-containing membrane protein [uncultured Cohaesibacter sp.]|uniref:DUF2301 domain-containing membrane protein n=1 Tax=uncultured Cohaesibacter sp. TaxID=1002546 RepID=UPI0029C62794|nr:DUF2301 domain-containing membrane protein [uncultured Cohaesibacter sp.]